MKILSIGDIHGRNDWKKKINKKEWDKVIFIGDYLDSYYISNIEILKNIKEIIQYKKKNNKTTELLFGNHEIHYLFGYTQFGCSGFRAEAYHDLHDLLNKNKNLFKIAHQINNHIWTHAGIHQGWYDYEFKKLDTEETLADSLNNAFLKHPNKSSPIFDVGHLRGGYRPVGGPLWLDKALGSKKPIEGYNQIVGHTETEGIRKFKINKNTSITYIDTGNLYSKHIITI